MGKIPEKKIVCHSCDNPGCVNPEHLWVGSPKENAEDCVKKGRNSKGTKNGNSKLKDEDISLIFNFYHTNRSMREIAKMFGVSATTIHKIITKKSWKK